MKTDGAQDMDLRARKMVVYCAGDIGRRIALDRSPGLWWRIFSEEQLTALHESCHCFAARYLCGFSVFALTLTEGMQRTAGICDFGLPGSPPVFRAEEVDSILADNEKIQACTESLARDGTQVNSIETLSAPIEEFLRANWRNIVRLSGELLWKRSLTEQEILNLLIYMGAEDA